MTECDDELQFVSSLDRVNRHKVCLRTKASRVVLDDGYALSITTTMPMVGGLIYLLKMTYHANLPTYLVPLRPINIWSTFECGPNPLEYQQQRL